MRAALVLTVGLIVAPMYELHAQESSLQQQPTPSRQDREQLEQNIYFGDAESRELGVRCGTRTPDDLERELIDQMLAPHLQAAAKQTSSAITVIPVAFHVATTKTGKFNVSDSQIARQMTVLNHSFEPHGYRFELTLTRRYRDNAFAKKCLNMRKERKFKNKHAEDPRRTLNIYTCRPAQGVLGYAYLPSDWRESDRRHGVVLLHSTLPGGNARPYHLGDTAVHEVGHYLGLFHTFDGGCTGKGDRVADTPAERTEAYGCPTRRDSCPADPGRDPVLNFMDYTDDSCMNQFTFGQAARIGAQLAAFKPSLGT